MDITAFEKGELLVGIWDGFSLEHVHVLGASVGSISKVEIQKSKRISTSRHSSPR